MIDYSVFINKLKSDLPVQYKVGFARDLQKIRNGTTKVLNNVFVLPFSENVKPLDSSGSTNEIIEQQIEILCLTRDRIRNNGSDLQKMRNAVHSVIVGWTPAGAIYPAHMVRGSRTAYANGIIAWSDIYQVEVLR